MLGDYNGNGSVDAADYTIWKDNFGSNVAPGSGADGNNNGVIDAADYTVWKDNFGNSLGNASVASVPEPASVCLMTLAMLALTGLRRRG